MRLLYDNAYRMFLVFFFSCIITIVSKAEGEDSANYFKYQQEKKIKKLVCERAADSESTAYDQSRLANITQLLNQISDPNIKRNALKQISTCSSNATFKAILESGVLDKDLIEFFAKERLTGMVQIYNPTQESLDFIKYLLEKKVMPNEIELISQGTYRYEYQIEEGELDWHIDGKFRVTSPEILRLLLKNGFTLPKGIKYFGEGPILVELAAHNIATSSDSFASIMANHNPEMALKFAQHESKNGRNSWRESAYQDLQAGSGLLLERFRDSGIKGDFKSEFQLLDFMISNGTDFSKLFGGIPSFFWLFVGSQEWTSSDREALKKLVDAGVDLNALTEKKSSITINNEIFGASVDGDGILYTSIAQDERGTFPMEGFRDLLFFGADPNVKNRHGNTVLEKLIKLNYLGRFSPDQIKYYAEAVKLLVAYGANTDNLDRSWIGPEFLNAISAGKLMRKGITRYSDVSPQPQKDVPNNRSH